MVKLKPYGGSHDIRALLLLGTIDLKVPLKKRIVVGTNHPDVASWTASISTLSMFDLATAMLTGCR